MNQPDTSDLHKFFATLGMLIIALSFLIFWTISTTYDVFLINNDVLNNITAFAKENILKKQKDLSCLYDNRYKILLIMIGFGIAIFLYGIVNWKRKQNIIDAKELAKETKKQTDEQKDNNLRRELMEEEKELAKETKKQKDNNLRRELMEEEKEVEAKYRDPKAINDIINTYKDIEKNVFDAIYGRYKDSYYIRNNAVFNNAEYDIIMFPTEKSSNNNILNIEVKYYTRRIIYSYLVSGYRKFLISVNKFNEYLLNLDKNFRNVEYKLLWVYKNDEQLELLLKYKKELEDSDEYEASIKINIKIINEKKIDEFKLFGSDYCT
jgi:hypothetical protein